MPNLAQKQNWQFVASSITWIRMALKGFILANAVGTVGSTLGHAGMMKGEACVDV